MNERYSGTDRTVRLRTLDCQHGYSAALGTALAPRRQMYIEKILGVLEHKVTDPTARTKAAAKLATLSDRQLKLMAALSERVAVVGDGPADSIALFLLTALLILS